VPFTINSKIKIFSLNLTKEVKTMYNENFKTLKKEIEEDGKTFHAHGLAELIL
jgi:hypothetical protein